MPGDIQLGNNYEISEDQNGDILITDKNSSNVIMRWDDSEGKWIFEVGEPVQIAELIDGAGTSHTGELADSADLSDYLLIDGTRAMSGALDMGSNAVSNASNIDATSYTVGSNNALLSVVASGQVALSSGTATVDTGISTTDATFYLALGVDDPGADTNLAGKLVWDDSAGTYKITIDEVGTSVGNPTANYDVLRVR